MRVVSLVPSVTETLLAWGVEPVAVTRFCEQPHLPTVGGTKNPDVAAIVALEPDLVVVDEEENRRADHDALVAAGLAVHVTGVRHLAHVGPTLAALADRVGVGAPAVDLPPPTPEQNGTVFVPIWRRPWMTVTADTYGASLLAHAGLAPCYGDAGDGAPAAERYPTVTLDEVAARRPSLALLPDEPYAFDATHAAEVADALGCPARVVDGADLFWWGVRTPGALARFAALVGSSAAGSGA